MARRPGARLAVLLGIVALAGGCTMTPHQPDATPLEPGTLPPPDVEVRIAQLGPCTDSADRTLRFRASEPVTVLVHGCRGSSGRFRALAQLHAFHGQQAVCFDYDAGASLERSSAELARALDRLAAHLPHGQVGVIGHSMGGLVARKAMEQERSQWSRTDVRFTLTTVSAPFAGIKVASPCGSRVLHWLSLGVVPAVCWTITGDNWLEITPGSGFILNPGPLLPAVARILKVVTDERGACRRADAGGRCLESDDVFSLAEQYHPVVDRYPRLSNVEVRAGHVEIVGAKDVVPRKLLEILQREGILAPTPPARRAAFERLLAELY